MYNSNSTTLFIGDTTQNPTGQNSLAISASFVGAATETLTSSTNSDQNLNLVIGGTATAGDVVSVIVNNANLVGGEETASYTVASGNTLTNVASGLASAINADTKLQAIGVGASSASTTVTVTTDTSYTKAVSGSATETITLGTNNRGNITTTISGAPTTGDVLTITAHNQSLSGGSAAASYTVLSSDTLLTIANGLAAAINAVTGLQTLGVSAATNLATQTSSQSFTGTSTLPAGTSAASVTTIDGSNNTKTNNYLVSATGTPSTALTYDANGNMTSDGTNAYSWDAENRLIKVSYPGTGNNSQFAYDGFGHPVKIVETSSGSVTSTKQFVWSRSEMCEARTAGGTLLNQYFPRGQTISGSNYFYTRDQLGSVRELTDSSANIHAQYNFDPFGKAAQLQGSLASDFQYAGYYFHAPSLLSMAVHRDYSGNLGRWISRDPIEEHGGINLYGYVKNRTISLIDPMGLDKKEGGIEYNEPPPVRPPANPVPGGGDVPEDPHRKCPIPEKCVDAPTSGEGGPPTRVGTSNDDCRNGNGMNNCLAPDGTVYTPQGKPICSTMPAPSTPPPPPQA